MVSTAIAAALAGGLTAVGLSSRSLSSPPTPAELRPHYPFYPLASVSAIAPASAPASTPAPGQRPNQPPTLAQTPAQSSPLLASPLLASPLLASQPLPTQLQPQDAARFQQVMTVAQRQSLAQQPMGDILQAIAQTFLGSEYREQLLDQSEPETLVTSLTQFDCVLFVESVLALARAVAAQDYRETTFIAHIADQRYRQDSPPDYCSRLHYWSDWIADNQEQGTVQNITAALGGDPLPKTLNFMTRHRQSYPKLAQNDRLFACIQATEARLANIPLHYIPTHRIADVYPQLQPGDIIAIATDISGLDVTHTGLAYRQSDGQFGLIHASPAGRVVIARDLETYVSRVERAIGIIVARPVAK
jgi:hypothetical protein